MKPLSKLRFIATSSASCAAPVTRRLLSILFGSALLIFGASNAFANIVNATISCSAVTFQCTDFPDAANNTVHETVSVDGSQVASSTFIFTGPTGSNTIVISVPPGDHTIEAHADWNTNGVSGTFDLTQDVSCGTPPECTVIDSINSGFNGTAVVGASSGPAFIWFNSNLSAKGMTAGKSIFLTDSKVLINGVPQAVPDAKITFAAVPCATTSFDAGTNTWNTTVPLAGSDEIFISGLAFPVTNLAAGAQVTWQGTFGTDQPGACLSWKWGAAAYKSFTLVSSSPLVIDYNAARIKPTHQASCLISNGDHAGTPQDPTIRASVTGGARGGGGSNFTGSWSGTGSLCPVCPTTPEFAPLTAAGTKNGPVRAAAGGGVFALRGLQPNPGTRAGVIRFALADASPARLDLMDIAGRLLLTREVGNLGPGEHAIPVTNGAWLPPGIYLARLTQGSRVAAMRITIVH